MPQSDFNDWIFCCCVLNTVSALLVVIAALSTGYVDHCFALLSSSCVGQRVINLFIFHICESAEFHVVCRPGYDCWFDALWMCFSADKTLTNFCVSCILL